LNSWTVHSTPGIRAFTGSGGTPNCWRLEIGIRQPSLQTLAAEGQNETVLLDRLYEEMHNSTHNPVN